MQGWKSKKQSRLQLIKLAFLGKKKNSLIQGFNPGQMKFLANSSIIKKLKHFNVQQI
jgi:hypothetical protein